MILTAKRISEGDRIPTWWGVSWFDVDRQVAHCYPIPLNIFVRWALQLWWWCHHPARRRTRLECAHSEGRSVGFQAGHAVGYRIGVEEGKHTALRELGERFEADCAKRRQKEQERA